jgi:hypothetical protein
MIANIMGVQIESLQVSVTAGADVRGTLAMSREVPVGFQAMTCTVEFQAREGTDPNLIERLKIAAERSCVVLQTLRSPPPVEWQFKYANQPARV